MHSVNLICHDSFVAVSFFACIAGLLLMWGAQQNQDYADETEESLLRMSFAYWLVYCFAFGIEKIVFPEWDAVVVMLRITTVLSYFLTFSCILSIPLHKFAAHEIEE
jgi:hypothetical protein